jgi:hypothetical protein
LANKSNYFPRRSSHFKNYKVILSGRGSPNDINLIIKTKRRNINMTVENININNLSKNKKERNY